MCRIWTLLALSLATALSAADYRVEKNDVGPPQEVSEAIRGALGTGGLEIRSGDKTVVEVWVREDVPMKDSPSGELGVSFGQLGEGVLFGVVRLTQEWRDYKNLGIAPGVYTLRYGVKPQDGNHMGVSIYRDFLLLIPAEQDTEVGVSWSPDELYRESYGATGQPHPGVMALFPVYDEITEPTVTRNEMDQPTLAIQVGSMRMGLVIEGHGEIQ